jgi:ABC-2 type transport system permease protein
LTYDVELADPFAHAAELIRFALYGMFEPVSALVVAGATVTFLMVAVLGYDLRRGMRVDVRYPQLNFLTR